MPSKKILGLDLGTNSIGWAVIEENESEKHIAAAGSRILPMDAKQQGDFESGNSISETGDRTRARGVRRMYERHALRRERLNRVLSVLGFLPKDYADALNNYGQIQKDKEPKLDWTKEGEFLFKDSFLEMVKEFQQTQPQLFTEGKTIPYDWTIYYLRKKALTQPLTKHELAWVLHQFNSKRGYNQSRSEQEETNPTEHKEFMSLRVVNVINTGEVSKGRTWYEIHLENGWIYRRQSAYPLDWEGKVRDFIVTTKLNEDGTEKLDKDGNVKRSLSAPSEDDWGLKKLKTEHDILGSQKTVGEFIFDALLANPDQKIIGQLVRTVDRKFYKDELRRILDKQKEFLPELNNRQLYDECTRSLYHQNEAYRNSIATKDFTYLLLDDVLFYQRPLKSKKSLISECPYEFHTYRDKDGNEQRQYLKCISKSHPLYEEFRVWQFVNNLRLYSSEDGLTMTDISEERLNRPEITQWLLTQKEVEQKTLLKFIAGKATKGLSWNYVSDKVYPMAPTRALIDKAISDQKPSNDTNYYEHLWHILYSVSDKQQLEQAIMHYAEQNGLDDNFVKLLKKQKPFAADYGAYSEKATRKLLALMRSGETWSADAIDPKTQQRIAAIIASEADDSIDLRVREKCKEMSSINDMQGLPVWLAEYVVYGVRKHDDKWNTPEDIDQYLQAFRLHSLNNPVVEQVVKETLRTVRDIWKQMGNIDEIHLEMGRELKLPADKRKLILQRNTENEKANEEARQKLAELLPHPSIFDIKKYRLWEEQGKCSPYTGQPIALSALFSSEYEIEHVIPQSRYFDDSMTNKIVCEAEVNRLKDRLLGHEFIAQYAGTKVTLSGGKVVQVSSLEAYETFIKEAFKGNRVKQEKMMMDDIPDTFIARQLNDSRYISNLMRGLLSNIVREKNPETGEYEPEATSKNLIATNGAVTDRLKKDWGVNDAWNHIILPRFERLNALLGTTEYTTTTETGHVIPTVPDNQKAGFNKKRIDHRHHAMDAIVIACATRNHVALLSNANAANSKQDIRIDLNRLLRETEVSEWNGKKHIIFGNFKKPWSTFTQDVEAVLKEIIVSFKQNLRIINKSNNKSVRIVEGKKKLVAQTKGENWAIRKPMHKETVFGLVNLQMQKTVNLKTALQQIDRIVDADLRKKLRQLVAEGYDEKRIKKYFETEKDTWQDINLQKIEVYVYTNETNDRYYATRVAIDETFDEKTIREKVTDTGIQKILLAHLAANNGDPQLAFSSDGLERMNANIQALNDGTPHKPIYKVRKYEKADKFAVGQIGVKAKKFVEAAKGTNLFFAIYVSIDKDGNEVRSFVTVPMKMAIDSQKEGKKDWRSVLDRNIHTSNMVGEDAVLKYLLSPGDLVYVPKEGETGQTIDKNRLYKFVSCTGNQAFFILSNVASIIIDKVEYSLLNKMERAITGETIKQTCVPVQVDRLGNLIEAL